jgi:uncharacterized OB-fold protein
MSDESRDAGHADLLDAIESDEGYYLACENGHGSLPPQRICPECGSRELTQEALPEEGEVETFTVIHATTPSFAEDTPYVVAVVDLGPVGLTGQVRGVEPDAVETGTSVRPTVVETETTGERTIGFRPQ